MQNVLNQAFATPWALTLLAVLPPLGVIGFLAARKRRDALARLGELAAIMALTSHARGMQRLRRSCLVTGLVLLIVGIAGPRWGPNPDVETAPGRDLVVVLDLSRSMLAQDVLPSRLERAKQAFADLSRTLQQRGGHRVGLIAFAARAMVVCPLTHDYDHFRAALADLDAGEPPPGVRATPAGSPSGTRIGEALRLAVETHDPRFHGFQDILMISDGDDPARDEEWRMGAEAARAQGIPVHTIGVGDPETDSRIPVKDDAFLKHDREVVLTRLRERPLEEIARMTNGTYTPARTQALPLGELFQERLETRAERDRDEDALSESRPRYAWFLGAAALFFAVEMLLGRRQRAPRKP